MTSTLSRPLRLLAWILLSGTFAVSCFGGGAGGGSASTADAGGAGNVKGIDLLAGASAPRPQGAPSTVPFTTREGAPASVKAMPGEVIVMARPGVFDDVAAAVKARSGTTVIGALPTFGVVLAKLDPGQEGALITSMREVPGVMDAFPNFLVTGACIDGVPPNVTTVDASEPTPIEFPGVVAQLDVYTGDEVGSEAPSTCVSHGEVVNCFLDGRRSGKPRLNVTQVNLAGSDIEGMPTSYSIIFAVARLIQGAKNRPGPAVINVSLGPEEESPETYAFFFYQMYEMLAVLSPETRDRIAIVVSAGNDGIPIGPAIRAAKQVAAQVDPDAAAHVVVAGGTELDEDGKPEFNNSDDPDDLLCAPGCQTCALSATRNTGEVCGTSYSAPQVTELIARLGSQSRYAALGAAKLIQAVRDGAACATAAPCACKTIPTLEVAEKAANALLASMGTGGAGGSTGTGGSAGTSGSGGSGGIGGSAGSAGIGGFGGASGSGGSGGVGGSPDAGVDSGTMLCCCRFDAEHYCDSSYDPCWNCVYDVASPGSDYLCGSSCNAPLADQCVTTCP